MSSSTSSGPETSTALGSTIAAAEGSTSAAITARGATIGRYVVLSKLGAGAMGIVLAAYDPELDRKVALKLLETQRHGSARARLQREAQALAKLAHANVVAVHDVGEHDGQLFVAMELVAGKTLGAWMAEVSRPRPWKEVVRVFSEAGRGLAAAHEVGLVHRDFKPENVMLGDDDRVRVMDFGLARGRDDVEGDAESVKLDASAPSLLVSRLTQTGAMLGTPAYMSPEQFEGKAADARSDQFAFCVALYEALYGTRPFAGSTVVELCGAVTEGRLEPAPRGTTVPAWLRAIVVGGLAREPEQRWPSMRVLLERLTRDPGARRRKWLGGAALVGLLGGATWTSSWMLRADPQTCAGFDERLVGVWDEERRAEVRAAFEAAKLPYAAATLQRVERGLDEYAERWVQAREQACKATHNGEQSEDLLDLRMACLDERRLHVQATVDVLAEADATVIQQAVAAVVGLPGLDRCADADALLAEIPPPEDAGVAARVSVLHEQLVLAEARQRAGKYAEGLALADPVVAEATTLGYEPLRARAWLRRGWLQAKAGKHHLAETTLEQAFESALGQRMMREAAEASTLLVHVVGYGLARHEDGRRWAKVAMPLARAAKAEETRALGLLTLGNVAFSAGQYEEARADLERAVEIREAVLGPEHPDVAVAVNNLGVVARSQGMYEEARRHHERALSIQETRLGPEHPDVAGTLNSLGAVAQSQGKHGEARAWIERSRAIRESALGPEHPDVAQSLDNLGILARLEGRHEEARAHHERALAIRERTLGLEHPDVATSLGNLGVVAKAQAQYERARGYYERALAIRENTLGQGHPEVALSLNNLGGVANSQGDYELARGYLERALAIQERTLGPEHPEVARSSTNLAEAWLGLDEPSRAIPLLERALGIRTEIPGDPAGLAKTRFVLARALWAAAEGAGCDRERARSLAELARGFYVGAGETWAEELRAVQAWQAEHEP